MTSKEIIMLVTLKVMRENKEISGNDDVIYHITMKELSSGEAVHEMTCAELLPAIGKEDEKDKEELPENMIFRRNRNGHPLDMKMLREWIDGNFVCRLNKCYEWFALWRILTDYGFMASGETSISNFARQMAEWFPDATHRCSASEINRYKRGCLGDKPFREWDKKAFRQQMDDKQSMKGFARLYGLCSDLVEGLKEGQMIK